MAEQDVIRVVIVDDHQLLRTGLALLFDGNDQLELVGEAENGLEAIEVCSEKHPDVVIMDLMMPEMDGITATQIIRQNYPQTSVIALTSFGDETLVHAALQAGAISYLQKNTSADDLTRAIYAAHAGKSTLCQEATQALVHANRQNHSLKYDLTGREREVLTLMARGLSNGEIADRLTITRFTVKKHVSSILGKLNVSTRTEAVVFAMQNKLIEQGA